jgi:hypothetical protein
MRPEGELRKQSHDLKSLERMALSSGGFNLMGTCACGFTSFGDGQGPQAHQQVLAGQRAHAAEMAACTHPNASVVEHDWLGLTGWVCPDCWDEFQYPDMFEDCSPELRTDYEALRDKPSVLEEDAPLGETRKRVQFSPEVKKAVWVRDGGRCCHCRISDDEAVRKYGEHLHYDHIVPFSRNGADTEENCQLLCRGCDLAKGNRFAG